MKLEVGMYVRNNHFGIGKINKEYFDSNNKHWFNVQFNCYKDEDCHCGICEETMGFKASHNIIDLIEVGDYVNGFEVKNIMSVGTSQYVIRKGDGKYVCCGEYGKVDDGSGKSCYALQWNNDQIKEVLTHEQYKANCYKVVE